MLFSRKWTNCWRKGTTTLHPIPFPNLDLLFMSYTVRHNSRRRSSSKKEDSLRSAKGCFSAGRTQSNSRSLNFIPGRPITSPTTSTCSITCKKYLKSSARTSTTSSPKRLPSKIQKSTRISAIFQSQPCPFPMSSTLLAA